MFVHALYALSYSSSSLLGIYTVAILWRIIVGITLR